MRHDPVLLLFFGRLFLVKLHLWLLLVTVFGIMDLAVFALVLAYQPALTLIVLTAVVTPIGLVLSFSAAVEGVSMVRREIAMDRYPAVGYRRVGAAILAAVFFGIPGLATAGLGLLSLVPGIRDMVGYVVTRPLRGALLQTYEYLRLEDGS